MMTITEAAAKAIATIIGDGATEWKQAQADKAKDLVKSFLASKQIDSDTAFDASAVVTQNVSAMKQLLEKHGVLKNTAATPALIVEIKKQIATEDAEVKKIA